MCYHLKLNLLEEEKMMSNKQRGILIVAIMLAGAVIISGCTMSLSDTPEATPTLLPTGLFVSPFPSGENPMDMIEQFAKETASAQTAIASGATPGAPVTPSTVVAGTVITPQTGGTPTITPTPGLPSTPTNAVPTTPVVAVTTVSPSGPTLTPLPPGIKPASYTLQKGEFPYCIARRYNVNPDELLSINGISDGSLFMPGTTLKIPQTGNPFPSGRALHTHPDTYTVTSSDETVYGVACYYGDLEPAAIASANGIPVSATLSAGQKLTIP
jgi:LysM repeat protein